MKKLLFWATVVSGVGAVYLMYRRGVPLGQAAEDALTHPIGSFAKELKAAV